MVRPDLLLFGYFTVSVESEDRRLASDILLGNGISAAFDRKCRFVIPYGKRDKLVSLFEERVRYHISEPRGLYGLLLKNKRRVGVFVGAILSAILFFISMDTVWDVRIEGASEAEEEMIREELALAGLDVGKRWSKLDKSRIEINMLTSSESVAWLNINRRGTVAYVKVSDKVSHSENEAPLGYANIVAARDCVIEEIIVESGYAMVKKGESVRAGEVLISGVIPTELGGGFCYASGEVRGRYNDSVSVLVDRKTVEKIYSERILYSTELNFFGRDINIFKKYGQSEGECDIIEEKENVTLGKRLPLTIQRTYIQPYETMERELSDDELISLASERLREALASFLEDKEARRMVTGGELSGDGYEMICEMTLCSDVTKIQEFKVE